MPLTSRRAGLAPSLTVLAALLTPACTTTPGATRLPDEAPGSEAPALETAATDLPAAELPVEALDEEGVRGGRIAFAVDGDPEAVLDMLLDFDDAAGNRSWAREYTVLARDEGTVSARWAFEGKLGIDPVVELEFNVRRGSGGDATVTYFVTKPAFGLAAFFGDYQITPLGAARSLLVERVFIDSGIPLASATADDIASGLRDDAQRIRAWMRGRLAR